MGGIVVIKTGIASIESAYNAEYGGRQYKNCISLGWFCGVASSMGRHGLRNCSGPFDWYFSDFESVLKLMETDFNDFMARKNLSVDANDPKIFNDKKYGFLCNHDIQNDFETEYEEIYQKYMRRADRFLQDTKEPTCFIRAVRSEQEILYIEESRNYIYDVIKKRNDNNEIIFLLLNRMKELPNSFLWFRLGCEQYVRKTFEMRMMFETSERFSEYCRKNILSPDCIKQNKEFDREHFGIDNKISMLVYNLDFYDIEPELRKTYPDLEQGIYLFGAGTYGEIVSLYLIKKGIILKGVIDNNPKKQGGLCNGIPIIPLSQIGNERQNICITISDKKREEIEKQILDKHPDAVILTLRNIIERLQERGIVF